MEDRIIPFQFKKVMFLDADVVFDNPNWYSDVSEALDAYDAVHPFETIRHPWGSYYILMFVCVPISV